MTANQGAGAGEGDRLTQASDWFARLRAPDAAAVRDEFEAWWQDPDNARAYDEIAVVWALSGANGHRPAVAPPRRRTWFWPASIAAGLAAAVVLAAVALMHAGGSGGKQVTVYASSPGAMQAVTLADGSRVTLDRASRIRMDFAEAERRVIMEVGRARFAVAHDAAHPFVVLAGTRAVVARGTVFDVRLEGSAMEVTLLEGAVDLEERGANTPPRNVGHLRPGQAARFASSDARPEVVAARAGSWPTRLVSGDGMRLADVVAQANRVGPTQIVLATADLADLRVSGGYRPADTGTLAASLAAALDLDLDRHADGTIVLARTARTPAVLPQDCSIPSCPSP